MRILNYISHMHKIVLVLLLLHSTRSASCWTNVFCSWVFFKETSSYCWPVKYFWWLTDETYKNALPFKQGDMYNKLLPWCFLKGWFSCWLWLNSFPMNIIIWLNKFAYFRCTRLQNGILHVTAFSVLKTWNWVRTNSLLLIMSLFLLVVMHMSVRRGQNAWESL